MLEKLKSFIADDGFYMASLLIAVSVASFGLGRQSVIETQSDKNTENKAAIVQSELPKPPTNLVPVPLPQASMLDESEGAEVTISGSEVVASKSGTKYHLPTCSGAKSIKPENLITFASPTEAEAAGYTPAANCKGLQ